MSVNLPLTTCELCPHMKSERYYTADSWEHIMQWWCSLSTRPTPPKTDRTRLDDTSRIAFVERPSDKPKDIPEWCPLRGEDN